MSKESRSFKFATGARPNVPGLDGVQGFVQERTDALGHKRRYVLKWLDEKGAAQTGTFTEAEVVSGKRAEAAAAFEKQFIDIWKPCLAEPAKGIRRKSNSRKRR